MKTYILFSSMSRCDETDHQIVAVGDMKKLENLCFHLGVKSWTMDGEGGKTANDGRIKIVPAPVWEG